MNIGFGVKSQQVTGYKILSAVIEHASTIDVVVASRFNDLVLIEWPLFQTLYFVTCGIEQRTVLVDTISSAIRVTSSGNESPMI